jgi:hypothetical protein
MSESWRRTFSDDRAVPAIVERRFRVAYAKAIPVDGPLETPCLCWPSHLNYAVHSVNGYGRMQCGGKMQYAHRVAWLDSYLEDHRQE